MSGGSDDPVALEALATELARSAGALLTAYFVDGARRGELAATIASKSTRTDLVTAADRASEQLIVGELRRRRPDDSILGEEGGGHEGSSGLTWIVDPLDGTINFVYGLPVFAVSIGCERDGTRVAGVVYDPVRDELFSAALGHGARRDGEVISVTDPPPPLAEALVSTGFGYAADRRREQSLLLPTVLPRVRDLRRAGAAALDLCSVACGRVDAMYEAGLAPWDLAAGALVVTEAGGEISLLDGLVPDATTVVAGPHRLAAELGAVLVEARERADAAR